MSLQMHGSQRQSLSMKPVCWDSMSSAACVMMPPCGIHMTVSAQANGEDRVSKVRRLILRNSTFSVARFSTLKEERLTQSRPIQKQWNATSKSWFIIRNQEDIKSISPPTLTCRPKTSSNTTVHDSRLSFAFGIPSSLPDSMIVRQETWGNSTSLSMLHWPR